MRRKTSLRYFSESHAVYGEVERHFQGKGIKLPPEWNDLIAIACFPNIMEEIKLRPAPAPDERNFYQPQIQAFRASYSRDPDLVLEILVFARQCLACYDENKCDTQASRVRAFLIKNRFGRLVKENGNFRQLTKSEANKWYNRQKQNLKIIPVKQLQDGEIAQFLNVTKDSVKKARKGLSVTIKNGKYCYIRKGKI